MQFDHWLVTIGRLGHSEKVTPILLHKVDGGMRRLVELARAELEKRSICILSDGASPIERLSAKGSSYFASAALDLWWSRVHVTNVLNPAGTIWRLRVNEIPPEKWQGPAEGVIPPDSPVTISDGKPSKLTIIDL